VEEKQEPKDPPVIIRTPDYRLRVFVSSSLNELSEEREAVRLAITELHLTPIMFESGARPHPANELYRAYLSQSHIFLGIYWQSYGWIAPDMQVSGLEDEYNLSADKPRLIYIKDPAPDREPRLSGMLEKIRNENSSSFKFFFSPTDLKEQVANDLVLLLTEYFETARTRRHNSREPSLLHQTNVPNPRNTLIGRAQDLQDVKNLILEKDVALVTLTGPGGTGKSRLGIQVALDLCEYFRDGTYIVGLESVRDANFVIPSIAETLGIRETTGGRPIWEKLKEYLTNKNMLLFLDNFEHLLPAASKVAELLEACIHIKALVTSRAPLHLRCEKEFPVLPLPIPQPEEISDHEKLFQNSAVKLFIERGQAVKPDFRLTNENAKTVAEICRRLDGLPLAIELAAVRLNMMSLRTLLSRLEKSFDVLNNGMRDLPDRQRTLYSAIDWSYNLLDENEKCLLRRLSVFVGGWTLEAAESVCNPDGKLDIDVFSGLEKFIDYNLINLPVEFEGEPRFTMLETIRMYCDYRLSESGESSKIRANYVQYFLNFAEKAELELRGLQQVAWINKVEAEHENLRVALEYSLATSEENDQGGTDCPGPLIALRLSASLYPFWFIRGYWHEGQTWYKKALEICSKAPPKIHAKVLNAASLLAWRQGNTATARSLLAESIELCRKNGDKNNLAYALTYLGLFGFWNEDSATARSMETESATLFDELSDQHGLALVRFSQGVTAMWHGDYEASRTFFEQSVELFLDHGARWHAGEPIRHLGYIAMRDGHLTKAEEFYKESLDIAREIGDRPGFASGLISLGDVASHQHDYAQAVALYQESLEIFIKLDDKLGIALAKSGLGKIAATQGDHAGAEILMSESLSLFKELGDKGGTAWMIQEYAHMMIRWYSESKEVLTREQFSSLNNRLVRLLCEGLTLAQELGHIITASFCTLGLAGLAGIAGAPDRAARLWGAAEVLRQHGQGFMSTADKQKYLQAENNLRKIIDQDSCRPDYEKSLAMTRQQAEAYALEEKERL
jgi:predicted ATPase